MIPRLLHLKAGLHQRDHHRRERHLVPEVAELPLGLFDGAPDLFERLLEFHHVRPFADGGGPSVANIELRCRRHNDYEARAYFGEGPPRFDGRPPAARQ